MAKLKVDELAKELSADSKDVMRVLQKKGITVKSHMSVLSENEVELVRAGLAGKKPAKVEQQPAQPAGEFVPRVKRIPKAVVDAAAPAETAAAPAEEKPVEAAKPAAAVPLTRFAIAVLSIAMERACLTFASLKRVLSLLSISR